MKIFKKIGLTFFMIISSLGIYVYACGYIEWFGYDYQSMFTPEAVVDESYQSMFYAPQDLFYGYENLDNVNRFNSDFVSDWSNYIGKSESKDAIAYYLLNDTAVQYIPKLINKESVKDAKYQLNLKNQEAKDFLEFLQIAKEIEKFSIRYDYYWDYDNNEYKSLDSKTIATIEEYYNQLENRSDFYKNRIWFQLMKAKFYSYNPNDVITFFDSTSKNQPKNLLYYKALEYVAGVFYKQRNYNKSNVLYAQIFDEIPKLRKNALFFFHPEDETTFLKQVESAPTKEIKASLWAIYGYYTDEFKAMQEIYKIDSQSEHINFLLSRWVNNQESNINVYQEKELNSLNKYHKEVKRAINQNQFKWICEVTAQPNKLRNPEIWNLATGYLNVFQGNFKEADKQFIAASENINKDNQLAKNQIRLFQLINKISQLNKANSNNEKALIDDLNWLYLNTENDLSFGTLRIDYATVWIKKYLSVLYKNQSNGLMSELIYSDKSFIIQEKNLDKMIQLFEKKNKSDFEKLFVKVYKHSINDLYQCKAIYLYQSGNIDEAIAFYHKMKPMPIRFFNYDTRRYEVENSGNLESPLKELFGNPFNGRISDCSDCDHEAVQKVKYTPLTMLLKMKEMQTNIDNNQDVFNNALLIGNAYYNTSYYGNARAFYYNPIINNNLSNSNLAVDVENANVVLDFNQAFKYYNIALNAAQNDEQRAKATFMLAKIERNNYFSKNSMGFKKFNKMKSSQKFLDWNSFKSLKENYADTKYYQEVINECGYFRDYIEFNK
ncbi:hypothetical protein [Flavobacterium sp. I3-2]|uniref:hypothetical protein n=1 Tax=Flavobacterium sp. I3-2 TaxID=2748319 RepID=UPI0015B30E2A|nr:hypothetical protein [Flavobacterium sp. I3-2]